jgi:ubiquinone/menaquinone biosynthesis C-methylase UbiE
VIKNFYENKILPPLINCCCSTKPIQFQRQKVVPNVSGRVLEIGIGSGLNIPLYNKNIVDKIIAVEPSAELSKKAAKVAVSANIDITFLEGVAEKLEIADKSIDSILLTYTLCTIPDTDKALSEMKRVLKPNGKIFFCEHGLAPDKNIKDWQNKLNPIWGALFGGCNLNRNIPSLFEAEGFKIDRLETMYLPKTPKFIGYNFWGSAKI